MEIWQLNGNGFVSHSQLNVLSRMQYALDNRSFHLNSIKWSFFSRHFALTIVFNDLLLMSYFITNIAIVEIEFGQLN